MTRRGVASQDSHARDRERDTRRWVARRESLPSLKDAALADATQSSLSRDQQNENEIYGKRPAYTKTAALLR